jgi:hypothetical protein
MAMSVTARPIPLVRDVRTAWVSRKSSAAHSRKPMTERIGA